MDTNKKYTRFHQYMDGWLSTYGQMIIFFPVQQKPTPESFNLLQVTLSDFWLIFQSQRR